jgi:hypothetical protein
MAKLQDGDEIIDKIDSHMELLKSFLWGIYHGLITKIGFEPDANDIKLREFSQEYHSKRITIPAGNTESSSRGTVGSVGTGRALPLGGGHYGNLELLTSALTGEIEDQGASAEILEKMHQHPVDKELEKKEKAEKWLQATKKLVLFTSAKDGTMPATNIRTCSEH